MSLGRQQGLCERCLLNELCKEKGREGRKWVEGKRRKETREGGRRAQQESTV